MTLRPLLMAAFLAAGASPALATGTISCVSEAGASLDMTIGTLPVMAVINASVEAGGESWSTADGQIVAGQAFADDTEVRVDFTDPDLIDILVRLRLFRASEGRDFATAGTLQIVGTGAYAVVCTGP